VRPVNLHAVERDVGVVEIDRDLARRALMGLDEQIDQQRIDLRAVAIDLVILRAMPLRRVLKTIERALAGQRLASDRSTGSNLPASTASVGAPRKIGFSANRGPFGSERLRIGTGTKPNHSFSRCPL
jgi:hypothetical protein